MKYIRTFALAALSLATILGVQAQTKTVKLSIYDGITNTKLKTVMEQEATKLLTNINTAQAQDRSYVDFSGVNIATAAQKDVTDLWNNQHMACPDAEVVEHGITLREGYQVRNIPLIIYNPGGENTYQEAVINFDKKGAITGFSFTINPELFTKLMKGVTQNERNEVWDIDNRMQIINFVEQFRTSYNKKDIKFLEQIFSDDALIITGRVIKHKGNEVMPKGTDIQYFKQSKKEYLGKLRQTFASAKYIKVNFEDLVIVEHPTKKGIYGVTVLQKWNSSRYSDEGYVFMMWDFRNPKKPQIHVRTWQPKYIDEATGKKIDPTSVFTLGDFDL